VKIDGFKEWLRIQEVGTSTASVATYAMPVIGGPVARMYPEPITIGEDPFFAKKRHKKKRHRRRRPG